MAFELHDNPVKQTSVTIRTVRSVDRCWAKTNTGLQCSHAVRGLNQGGYVLAHPEPPAEDGLVRVIPLCTTHYHQALEAGYVGHPPMVR